MKIQIWVAVGEGEASVQDQIINWGRHLKYLVDDLNNSGQMDRVKYICRTDSATGLKLMPPPNELPF